MRFTKLVKALFFVIVILLVATVFLEIHASHLDATTKIVGGYPITGPGGDWREAAFGLGILAAVILYGIILYGMLAQNNWSVEDFEQVFGFNPKKNKLHLVDGDPQEYVSAEIERRRLDALAIFSEERKLQKEGGVFGPEKLRKKVKAKEKFWAACKSAHDWGFQTPSSINESVSNLHKSTSQSVHARDGGSGEGGVGGVILS